MPFCVCVCDKQKQKNKRPISCIEKRKRFLRKAIFTRDFCGGHFVRLAKMENTFAFIFLYVVEKPQIYAQPTKAGNDKLCKLKPTHTHRDLFAEYGRRLFGKFEFLNSMLTFLPTHMTQFTSFFFYVCVCVRLSKTSSTLSWVWTRHLISPKYFV